MVTKEKNNWDKGYGQQVFAPVAEKNVQRTTAELAFVSSTPSAQQDSAEKMLSDFQVATANLLQQELSFQQRKRLGSQDKLSLSSAYLRGSDHVRAQETFNVISEKIIAVNPDDGQKVVKEAEQGINGALTVSIKPTQQEVKAKAKALNPTKHN